MKSDEQLGQVPAEVREAIVRAMNNRTIEDGTRFQFDMCVDDICVAIAPFFAAFQPSADVDRVAAEIRDAVVTTNGMTEKTEIVATILRRHDAEKNAEIVRLTEIATKRLISLNTTDELLKATEQRAEKAETKLASERLKTYDIKMLETERDTLHAEVSALKAEVEMLRGVGCGEVQETEDGPMPDGPCGVCIKCLRSRAESAERDVADLSVSLQQQTDLAATLTAQLATAQEDSKRLDWLDEQSVPITRAEKPGWKGRAWDIESDEGTSLRIAIDAARTTS